MIHIEKYHALAEDTRKLLRAFIHAEFGHIPIVQQTTWAQPDWTTFYTEGDSIVTFYNIVERYVEMDGISYKSPGGPVAPATIDLKGLPW